MRPTAIRLLVLLCIVSVAGAAPGFDGAEHLARRPVSICVPGVGQMLCNGWDTNCDRIVDSCDEWIPLDPYGAGGIKAGEINGAWGLSRGADGNIVVPDTGGDALSFFDPNGIYIRQFGDTGSGPGQLSSPWRTAEDADGNLYVIDRENDRIQKFDPTGRVLLEIPGDNAAVSFRSIHGIAVDAAGFIYVAENFLGIAKFDADGEFVSNWGKSGPGVIEFGLDIALAPDQTLYVADFSGNIVKRFDTDGNYLNSIGGSWAFSNPVGLDIDEDHVIYVADWSPKVRSFAADGSPLDVVYPFVDGLYSSSLIYDVAKGPGDTVYVTSDFDVVQLSMTGELLHRFGRPSFDSGESAGFSAVAIDATGSLYAVDLRRNKMVKFDPHGQFDSEWALPAGPTGQVKLKIAPDGDLWLLNSTYRKLLRLSPEGVLSDDWSQPKFDSVQGFAVFEDGSVLLSENSEKVLLKLSPSGEEIARWPVGGGSQTVVMGSVDIGPDGKIYLFSSLDDSILVYSGDGDFLESIGTGEFDHAIDLAVRGDGSILILDSDELVELNPGGQRVRSFPVFDVRGIADSPNQVYLANNRIGQIQRIGCRQLGTWYRDRDGDLFGTREQTSIVCGPPDGYSSRSGDCNDRDVRVNPSSAEECDGFDNDCNFRVDDEFPGEGIECAQTEPGSFAQCVAQTVLCEFGETSIGPDGTDLEDGGLRGPDRSAWFSEGEWDRLRHPDPTAPIVQGDIPEAAGSSQNPGGAGDFSKSRRR